ncbi:acylphosphatase-2 [Drosophila tropicalis]|uniref:acylphosphatase-2 n=1 Tax=Drosophila tropicalis TaxID=46794 RepID=UPI0035AB7E04
MGTKDAATQTHKKKRAPTPVEPVPLERSESRESRSVQINSGSFFPLVVEDKTIYNCSFEIFGIVQGVSFRMYTLRKATKLGVVGWCKNTLDDTVKGEIEGYARPFDSMRLWLEYTGSPTSRIDKCIFGETKILTKFTYQDFSIQMD